MPRIEISYNADDNMWVVYCHTCRYSFEAEDLYTAIEAWNLFEEVKGID